MVFKIPFLNLSEDKRLEHALALIEQLKRDKADLRKQRRELTYSFSTQLSGNVNAAIEFIAQQPYIAKRPYLFVGRKEQIAGYTETLAEVLDLQEDFQGRRYTELFNTQDDQEIVDILRACFKHDEEQTIIYEARIKGKKQELKITRQPSIYSTIDLTLLGRERETKVLAFTPVRIEPTNLFSFSRKYPNITKIYDILREKHEWRVDKILQYENDYGILGLVDKYMELKSESPKQQ